MFHLLTYEEVLGVNATNVDLDATPDENFSRRNNHYIFSEQYNLIAAAHVAASALRSRLNVPSINAIARHQFWPVNRSATIPSHPRINDFRGYPIALPINEEIAVEASNNLGAATEPTSVHLWIAPPNWTRNLPRGLQRLTVRATAAIATVQDAWSASGALVFDDNLRGGWYAIVGASCFDAGTLAFRLNFPRMPLVNGRKLLPGSLCTEAVGNVEFPISDDFFGLWGYFMTFEEPQIQVYADAAGASTQELFIDVVYMGTSAPPGALGPTGLLSP